MFWCSRSYGVHLGLALITASSYALPGAELTSPADAPPFLYLTMRAGPLYIALAGILVIALAYGRVGLRDLRSRLFRWRVAFAGSRSHC